MIKTQVSQVTGKTISAQIVNGFVTGGIGGNPAGVVLDADKLNETEMLSIYSFLPESGARVGRPKKKKNLD